MAKMRGERLDFWAGALIAVAPLLLLVNCWNAPFLPYDDSAHIFTKHGRLELSRIFLVPEDSTYFPITILSYRLDSLLFPWMYELLGTWAPGVRLMTCVYHAGAALFAWRIVRLLGVSPAGALLVALSFAVHPTACETVCWASERKNALAGLFGFASIWAFLRFEGRERRMPLAVLFYLLAVWSKPSALGLAPVLLLADLCGGVRGLAPGQAQPWRGPRYWAGVGWRFLPFLLLSGGAVIMNLIGHARTLVPPPGGTAFTAFLTDAEILSRYLYNVFLPVGLSIAYFVAPITSPLEPRFLGYAVLLAALCAATVWLAANRRLALFGWLWFVLALGPSLNLISIPHVMQDRYIYLSLPGILLVCVEALGGLIQRARLIHHRDTEDTENNQKPQTRNQKRLSSVSLCLCGESFWPGSRLAIAAAIPCVAALAALGIARGGLFGNMYLLFEDGVRKQPLAAHAHHGLSVACAQICEEAKRQKHWPEMDEARHRCGRELQCFIDFCPDATRQVNYLSTAHEAGKYALVLNQPAEAERYFRLVLHPPPWFSAPKNRVIEVLTCLSAMKLESGQAQEAYALAGQAVVLSATSGAALFARASAALALAMSTPAGPRRDALRRQAENDLAFVPQSSPEYGEAQEVLRACKETDGTILRRD